MTTRVTQPMPRFWEQTAEPLSPIAEDIARMFAEIDAIGRREGAQGYTRGAWTDEDLQLRQWFTDTAESLGLAVSIDNAGNQWAWWGVPTSDSPGISTGSHLDSVPDGGAFDGPLGVISAFAALADLQRNNVTPPVPVAVVNFSDEEGGRFGIACVGSRVATGVIPAQQALALTDAEGITLETALATRARDVRARYGRDTEHLSVVSHHIEVHIEQGFLLAHTDKPVGLATHIWPHGRWRVEVSGEANHAGTTPMDSRDDALVKAAELIGDLPHVAARHDSRATIGRVLVEPGGTNVVPGAVTLWVDIRGATDEDILATLADIDRWQPQCESRTEATWFDSPLLHSLVAATGAPAIGTAAGHDAGVLQNYGVPTAMIFVRNGTGASHTPAEFATLEDCCEGVQALITSLITVGEAHANSVV